MTGTNGIDWSFETGECLDPVPWLPSRHRAVSALILRAILLEGAVGAGRSTGAQSTAGTALAGTGASGATGIVTDLVEHGFERAPMAQSMPSLAPPNVMASAADS